MIWIILAVMAVLLVWPFVRGFVHSWRASRAPLTNDWCRVCQRELRRGEVWEVRSDHEAGEDGVGGTYLAITYCRHHKPRGAVKA